MGVRMGASVGVEAGVNFGTGRLQLCPRSVLDKHVAANDDIGYVSTSMIW